MIIFLTTMITYGIEFLVNASFCCVIWSWILVPNFGFPTITFWEMYCIVWFVKVLTGNVFQTFFDMLLENDDIKEAIDSIKEDDNDDDNSAYFTFDISDPDEIKEFFDKFIKKENPKDKEDKEEDTDDGKD